MGGGSIMVWAAFSQFSKVALVRLDVRMNSVTYQAMLSEHLLPFLQKFQAARHIFQQDNAPCHASASTKQWLMENNVQVLDWPARSPDCNPVENLWGIMVRDVYANSRQYSNTEELWQAVQEAWARASTEQLGNLVNSMPKRIFKVINKQGKPI
jgi:hypothetical protein